MTEFMQMGDLEYRFLCNENGVDVSEMKLGAGKQLPEGFLDSQKVGESNQPAFCTVLTSGTLREKYWDGTTLVKDVRREYPSKSVVTQNNTTGSIPVVYTSSGCRFISILPDKDSGGVGVIYRSHKHMHEESTYVVGDSEYTYISGERFTLDSQVMKGNHVFRTEELKELLIAEVVGTVIEFDVINDEDEFERRSQMIEE